MENNPYHIPVLLHVATDALIQNKNGCYVDLTFGGGGHSKEILSKLDDGKLLAFDQDEDALKNSYADHRFNLVRQNFRHLQNVLNAYGYGSVDGVLADLGVSSYQFDTADRGFSFRFDAQLDIVVTEKETDNNKAKAKVEEMCKKLLANLVIEDYKIL